MAGNSRKNAVDGSDSTAFTHSGHRVNLDAPTPASILAADLAEHLAKQAMFRGATRGLYTKAQHCSLVAGELAYAAGPLAAMYGLLHHADATYSDKPNELLCQAIHESFGLAWPMAQSIETELARIHDCVELTELRQLCAGCGPEIAALERRGAAPFKRMILPLGWDRAHERFVDALRTYIKVAGLPKLPAFGSLL